MGGFDRGGAFNKGIRYLLVYYMFRGDFEVATSIFAVGCPSWSFGCMWGNAYFHLMFAQVSGGTGSALLCRGIVLGRGRLLIFLIFRLSLVGIGIRK